MTARFRALTAAAGVLFLWSAPAAAQVFVTPDTVAVSLAQGETAEVVLAVSNAGADTTFALSLAPAPRAGDPPEAPGTVLFTSETICCGFLDLTTTPDGRLFVKKSGDEALEFTPELAFVREFEHPRTKLVAAGVGIAYDADRGTLWFLDVQSDDNVTEQALLLEADLDGEATGRTLPAFWDPDATCLLPSGRPAALAYDAAATPALTGGAARFFYLDHPNDTVWATDTTGLAAPGYPYPVTDYPGPPAACLLGTALDAHALSSAPGVAGAAVLEVMGGYPDEVPSDLPTRVVVTDRAGRSRGAETPLVGLPTPDGFGSVLRLGGVVRSRLDPSVLYLTVVTGLGGASTRDWVYAVRAAPLPPVWLRGGPILFEVESDGETELTLTLDASGLGPGVYEAVASVRAGDGIGPVVAEVPVTLTVAPVSAEDAPEPPGAFRLGAPYPNPAAGRATVPVTLTERAEVRVAVLDVLGREVAVLHDGFVEAGTHRFAFDAARLPSGVYFVRATSGLARQVQPLTVVP
ncbi:MAG: T9SS type A sorting domain-containing protein [Bacteroidota bacterium]